MPFLRVVRDRRGYEVTYLMHLYRDGHRQRSRILYVFRTPGGVRVGRHALEPDVLRQIAAAHPELTFDWKQIRDSQHVVELGGEPRRRRAPKASAVPSASGTPASGTPASEPSAAPGDASARLIVPSTIAGETPDEQIAFLGEWYPVIRDRVPKKTSDPSRQAALRALAERLNPAGWTDADQITTGLQQAGEALERLSRVFSRRRRRRRRPGQPAMPKTGSPAL
jgi:hypothetical protein